MGDTRQVDFAKAVERLVTLFSQQNAKIESLAADVATLKSVLEMKSREPPAQEAVQFDYASIDLRFDSIHEAIHARDAKLQAIQRSVDVIGQKLMEKPAPQYKPPAQEPKREDSMVSQNATQSENFFANPFQRPVYTPYMVGQ